jgi:hypothetical protein
MTNRRITESEHVMGGTKNSDVSQPKPDEKIPPAGPHAKPELTDPEKTPGSGILPEEDQPDVRRADRLTSLFSPGRVDFVSQL